VTKLRGRHPDVHLLHDAQRTANTTFQDRHPDVPPLALEPPHRTTQPLATHAAQGRPLADHGRRTNIWGRRLGLKVKPPPAKGLRQSQRRSGLQ
jgi:hypothetical protein